MRLVSVQVGRPREMADAHGREWVSAIHKTPVVGPVFLDVENLDGDEQADPSVHGGPDKAVCVYSADNYSRWVEVLGADAMEPGAFGENFTVAEADEWSVCVGDVYSVGDARVEVTQPRGPCWKLGRKWGRRDFPGLVQASRRTGWYLRVLEPGSVAAGDAVTLLSRPYQRWTIAEVNRLRYEDRADLRGAAELAGLVELSASWRATFQRRVETGVEPEEGRRLHG